MKKIKKEEFINNLKDVLEIEEDKTITAETNLKDLEEYDSLSTLVIVAMVEKKYGKQIFAADFVNVTTINSLMNLIGKEIFE